MFMNIKIVDQGPFPCGPLTYPRAYPRARDIIPATRTPPACRCIYDPLSVMASLVPTSTHRAHRSSSPTDSPEPLLYPLSLVEKYFSIP